MNHKVLFCTGGVLGSRLVDRIYIPPTIDSVCLNNQQDIEAKAVGSDLIFFYDYPFEAPESILSKYLCLSYHLSRLPSYKGKYPIENQIIDGLMEGCVTIYRQIDNKFNGPVYSQDQIALDGVIEDILYRAEQILVIKTIQILTMLRLGRPLEFREQVGQESWCKKYSSEITLSDLNNLGYKELYDKMRAFSYGDYSDAYILCRDGRKLFIRAQ